MLNEANEILYLTRPSQKLPSRRQGDSDPTVVLGKVTPSFVVVKG